MLIAAAAIHTRPSDNVAPNATITIQTGTDPGDTDYAPEVLADLNPARPAKILSTTGAWLFAYAQRQRVRMGAFIHGTFETSSTLRFQGNDTDSWGSPTLDVEIDVQPWLGAASATARWPRNHWTGDLTLAPGYTDAGFFYYRLICSGNSQNIWLGQAVLSPVIRRMAYDVRWDYGRSLRKRSIVNETAYGSKTIYARGTTQYGLEAEQRMDEDLFVDQEEHYYDADGTGLPWILVPDEDGPDVYFVRWPSDEFATKHHFFDVHDRKLAVEELSRGVRPGV